MTPQETRTDAENSCPNCKAVMPAQMRFCRACGYRMGEGAAEYTETVRFSGAPTATAQRPEKTPRNFAGAMPYGGGPMAPQGGGQFFVPGDPQFQTWKRRRRRGRKRWLILVLVIFMAMFVSSGLISAIKISRRGARIERMKTPTSYLGVSNLKNAQNGAMIASVSPPGSAADKSGLVGGDVVTMFDGKPVNSSDELRRALSGTPVGKTVDVTYVRDGETKTTKLTTISGDENDRLENVFDDRAEPKGEIGIGGLRQVQVPGMNIQGVQVGNLEKNYPASMAGIQKGDVIITFDGTPIRTVEELRARVQRAIPKKQATITLVRGTEKMDIPVMVGEED